MINFRYHLASLIAVFIALGIGMLIGNSFVGLASVESQTPLLKKLQQQVGEVSERVQESQQENASLKERLNTRDRALRTMAPRVLKGLLSGRRIALVVIGQPDRAETVTELSDILTAAGGKVVSTTTLRRNWLPEDTAARVRVLSQLQLSTAETDPQAATRALAKGIASGNWSSALHQVAETVSALQLDGDYTTPVGSVVLLTSANDPSEAQEAISEGSLERTLLDIWESMGLRKVVAEPETAPVSLISFFRNRNAVTIDNVDTVIGQIACAMGLYLGSGHYGVKQTADRLLPDLPLPVASTPSPVAGTIQSP
jgi:hypothetical protein